MKTSLLILSAFLTLLTTQTEAKVWILNQAPNQFNHFTNLQAAADDENVAAGDTLYCVGGWNYGSLSTRKTLTIIGPGHFISFDATTAPARRAHAQAGDITFRTNANGSAVIGMRTGDVYFEANDGRVIRCYSRTVNQTSTASGLLIESSFVWQSISLLNNAVVRNNITGGVYGTANNCIIENNVLGAVSMSSPSSSISILSNIITSSIAATNLTISYNAFRGSLSTFDNSVATFNICSGTQFSTAQNNTNNVDLSDEFLIVNTGGEDLKWRLRNTSPAKGKGLAGVDIGAFGGTTPYVTSGIPALPTVQEIFVPGIGTNSLPNVKVTFRARN